MVRTIGVVTGGRADYGILRPVLRAIQATPEFKLHLLVTGTHLAEAFGLTVQEIQQDGFPIGDRFALPLESDTPAGIATAMGVATVKFAESYARQRPDLLLVVGDRFEMLAAVSAALPFKIPIAHIHGGESTEGAIDESIRHAITKMSHLHFVSTEAYRRRVIQMGEEPWRVIVSGAPSLDNLRAIQLLSRDALEVKIGVRLVRPPLLVTYHPVTLEYEQCEWQVRELLAALETCERPIVFTMPNADTNGRSIVPLMQAFLAQHPAARFVPNLGMVGYFSMMAQAGAMVGNSSSGIIEAASFKLPVVNIGTRQRSRLHGPNVLDVGYHRVEIQEGIRTALSPSFRETLAVCTNLYGDGHAAERIVARLKQVALNDQLLVKRFYEVPVRIG